MDLNQNDWWSQLEADENAVIIDVRTPDEFSSGIIPGAINIDIYKGQGFVYMIEELDKTKNYYVYCHAGSRSAQACKVMNQLDISNAYNLLGGISNWNGPIIESN
jgi:rhodanese-related sulfurtransferase